MATLKVIDVSYHNGTIDWAKVKAAGIDGAILRCGYGMDQTNQDDKQYRRNADECTRLGIPFGIYLYSYADSIAKAQSEAQHALRLAKGYKLSYPIYYDLEQAGTESGAVERARVFCEAIEAAGYWAGIYANKHWWDNYLPGLTEYTRWVARYNNTLGMDNVDMWQYTSDGSVSGISGRVDMNHCYRDFPAEIGGGTSSGSASPSQDASAYETPDLVVDGKWGTATTKALQKAFGTVQDGKVSNQRKKYKQPGCYTGWEWVDNPKGYSDLIKAMQRKVGEKEDGWIGPTTIKALQKWMGTVQDGEISKESDLVKALQRWCRGE